MNGEREGDGIDKREMHVYGERWVDGIEKHEMATRRWDICLALSILSIPLSD